MQLMRRLILFFISMLMSGVGFANTLKYSMQPAQIANLSPKSDVVNEYNWRADVVGLHRGGVADLPIPRITSKKPMHLSLKEAILLSLRNNPSIISADLTRVVDKFAVLVAHNAFEPQYTLSGTATYIKGSNPIYSSQAGVNLKTKMGTTFGLNYSNTYLGGGGPGATNFSITQPLMQGFGAQVNLIPWYNALDTENQARLTFKGTIMDQVVTIIGNYYQLVQDYQNLAIQERTLQDNAETVRQSELRLKVGQLARSDLVQQKATYETTKLSLLTQRSSLISDYQTFLTALGLNAAAKVSIDKEISFTQLKVPSLDEAIRLALKGNIPYQNQLIAIRATERAVITAKDAARWQLNLTGSFAISNTQTQPQFITVNGVTTVQTFTVQNTPSLVMQLTIPINNLQLEQAIVGAEITLEQAKLALEGAKLALIRQITNEIQQIQNQILTLKSAEEQVKYQRESLQAIRIKYRFGRTTTFEMNQIQDQLLSQETSLVSNRVALINLIVKLNQDLGLTLEQWCIKLRY
ncbi:MAG: hypothetical protein A3F10_00870 [Coxiella sp. RIFCSPHIGHO2_12_FULL_42_15]|nr:MAG: hypothetical protein A3F10_00870 [Coxiella sp. RIFCSPHIGHO2_12_FULL_42_15]